ncbi:MAG: GFA family protein [Rhodospirillales bacterium]|nr:GFA family protein [Rhodospirillales bacterium]
MSEDLLEASGGCYCGAVRYRVKGVSREVTECHCSQCRKQAGHRYASTGAKTSDIEVDGAADITWYRASPAAERGFCSTCGSHLFWRMAAENYTGILAASLDEPSGLRMAKHIFVEDKGDYYEIDDGLPRFAGYDTPVTWG